MTRAGRAEWLWLVAILVLGAGLRLHHLTVPLVDTSDWRQTDTAAVAYFFYHHGIRLLHPQLWHDGPGPDYTQLELQISPAVAALLAHVVGFSDTLLRVVAVGFFTAAALPLWALVRKRLGPGVALWTVLCYTLLPVGIYFGRVFQPEAAMCFFGTLALWAADRWADHRTRGRYLLAAATAATAVMAKLPNGMLLPAIGALAYGPELWPWRRIFARPRLVQVAGLLLFAGAAGAAYTVIQGRLAANGTQYVDFIVTSLGSAYIAGTEHLWPFVWQEVLGMAVTPGGGVAALIGIVVLIRSGRRAGWVWAWTAGVLVYALVVLRTIRFQYYLMPMLPWLAVLMGVGLDFLAAALPRRVGKAMRAAPAVLAAALTMSILSGGLFQIREFWPPYLTWSTAGTQMDRTLPRNALLIVSGTFNPTVLYYARRHGFRVNPLYMSDLRTDVAAGARYLVDQGGTDDCMATYLEANFPSHGYAGITVYTLRDPLPPLPTPPPFQEQPPADLGHCAQ